MFETSIVPLDAFGSYAKGQEISQRQQQLDQQKALFELQQKKLQQEAAQKQAMLSLGKEAAGGNPQAIAMYSALNPEGGKALLDLHKQNATETHNMLDYFSNQNIADKPFLWKNIAPRLQQNLQMQGINAQIPADYSPEAEKFVNFVASAQSDLKDRYKTVESSQGLLRLDQFTGQLKPTGFGNKPSDDPAATGGTTGYNVRQIMKDNPGMNYTQALQKYQTGFRNQTEITPEGEIVVTPGAIQARTSLKGAESEGTTFGKDTGEQKALLRTMESHMPQLEDTVNSLHKLGQMATYTATGKAANDVRRQLGLPVTPGGIAREEYINTVRDQILPLLRQTFGSQFTEREGSALVATLGDPDRTPGEKDAALRSFITQKRGQIKSLQRTVGDKSSSSNSSNKDLEYFNSKYGL